MNDPVMQKLLDAAYQIFAGDNKLPDIPVYVKKLSPVEAIGSPGSWDYPLLRGREILLQATVRESPGQAYTSSPVPFKGKLQDVLELNLDNMGNRAIFIAVFNALLRDQKIIGKTVHCRNSDPEKCGQEVAAYLKMKHNPEKIGVAGYQPALISALVDYFGPEKINITDLDSDNLNKVFKGVKIKDGIKNTNNLITENSLLLVTGSVFVNNTADPFHKAFQNGKPIYFFGTTVTGIAHILGLPHICPLGS